MSKLNCLELSFQEMCLISLYNTLTDYQRDLLFANLNEEQCNLLLKYGEEN